MGGHVARMGEKSFWWG